MTDFSEFRWRKEDEGLGLLVKTRQSDNVIGVVSRGTEHRLERDETRGCCWCQ